MGVRLLLATSAAFGCLGHAMAGDIVVISQQGRAFNPSTVEIAAGDTLRIVNDDGDLLHHSYISSDAFSYDTGDQEPGTSSDIVFPVAGEFDVLCGIHPKMKLHVSVK